MMWRPKNGNNSWQQLHKDGNLDFRKRGFFNVAQSLFWRLPNVTFPFGEVAYWQSVDKFGVEEFWAPHNLWRGVWHFMFGATLIGLYFGMENEVKNGFRGAKTRFDLLAYISGAYTSFILGIVFI